MSTFPPNQGSNPYESSPQGQPPKKSGGGLKIVLIVLGVVGAFGLVACGGCIYLGKMAMDQGFTMLTNSVETQYGDHPMVVEHIGDDATITHSFGRTVEESQDGPSVLVFPVTGNKGSGEIIGTQAGERVTNAKLVTSDGTEYPLD